MARPSPSQPLAQKKEGPHLSLACSAWKAGLGISAGSGAPPAAAAACKENRGLLLRGAK